MGTAQVSNVPGILECKLLIKRFQNGETSVFSEIVNNCRDRVRYIAYNFTQNWEDAFDISQEVFIKVFRSINKLNEISAFDAWLKRVTINACMDHLRQRNNERLFLNPISLDHESIKNTLHDINHSPEENNELQKVIAKAVKQLPKGQRRVFSLRYYDGLSLKEISEELNCSVGTVKAHLFRATRRLRKLLTPYIQ
ncbi:sigma-70 family RNA polymerase sigma factor [Candidatus Poribacteria bacterium]|nr:sigma-70 family RNA polymerase sigma factor [Candidatus Poribacteria bacterium]